MNVHISAFYKFFPFTDYMQRRSPIKQLCQKNGVMGTLLLAPEGINATICGPKEGVEAVVAYLRTHPDIGDLDTKESQASEMPFTRLRVRLKREIISLGKPCAPTRKTGEFLSPNQWNNLLEEEHVIILDTRNRYEVEVGTFKGAINPDIKNFKELTDYIEQHLDPEKDAKIATFCTGGIRCEKLTSWMLDKGFKEVYQLHGGILKYLEEVPEEKSLWEGDCFVFDDRHAVGHGVVPSQKG